MKNKHLLPLILLCFFNTIFLRAQWTDLGSGIEATQRMIFSMHAVDENVIWAITGFDYVDFTPAFEFTRTTDGGQTWQPGNLDIDPDLYHFDIFALDDQTAWITTANEENSISGKIYKTTDGGETWVYQATAFTGFNETPAGIYFWNADEGVAFGATCHTTYNNQLAIYTTDDGGDNWTKVEGENMPAQEPGEGICWWSGNSNYAVAGDKIWFFSSANRVFHSVNRGLSWEVSDIIFKGGAILSMAFRDAQNGIVIGRSTVDIEPELVDFDQDTVAKNRVYLNRNRAFRTTDGGLTWFHVPVPASPSFGEIECVPGLAGTYLIHDADVAASTKMLITHNDGNSWELMEDSDQNLSCLEFLSPTVGFAGGEIHSPETGGIYRWDGDIFEEPFNDRVFPLQVLDLELFPVPVTDLLYLRLPEGMPENLEVQLYDSRGRQLWERTLNGDRSIPVYHLPKGIYQLRTVVGEQVYTGRFVRQ